MSCTYTTGWVSDVEFEVLLIMQHMDLIQAAIAHERAPWPSYMCGMPNCRGVYGAWSTMVAHVDHYHGLFLCSHPGCPSVSKRREDRTKHVTRFHLADPSRSSTPRPTLLCSSPGCRSVFTTRKGLQRHIRAKHLSMTGPAAAAADAPLPTVSEYNSSDSYHASSESVVNVDGVDDASISY